MGIIGRQSVFAPGRVANSPRFAGQAGHYEVWYLTTNVGDWGFWFRYTLVEGQSGGGLGECWAIVFPPGDEAPFALKASAPDALAAVAPPHVGGFEGHGSHIFNLFEGSPALVTAASGEPAKVPSYWGAAKGGGTLGEGEASGRLADEAHEVSWDLVWTPGDETLFHVPTALGRDDKLPTQLCSRNLGVAVTGKITVDGGELAVEGEPASQTHLWGKEHAAQWAWAHCSRWDEGNEGVTREAVFEGIWVRSEVLGPPVPITLCYLRLDGEDHVFNALPHAALARSEVSAPLWEARLAGPGIRVTARLGANFDRMAQVTYVDPDGTKAWCANSVVARAEVAIERRVGRRWELDGVLRSTAGCHLEFGARTPDGRLPVLI